MKLQGKIAIISGAGRGIGKAVALSYAREGAAVSICSRTESEIGATEKEVAASGEPCLSMVCDVTDEKSVQRWVDQTLSRFGQIDVLVNNAGVLTRPFPIAEAEISKWDYTLAVNLRGPFLLARAVLPHMIQRKAGSVINVTSSLGQSVWSGFGAYCVSKAALETLTKVLADEVKAKGIRVNSVDPGYVATKLTHNSGSSPDSVTPLFIFLATEESRAITGKRLTASGWRSEVSRSR